MSDIAHQSPAKKARKNKGVYSDTNSFPLCDGRCLHVDVAPGDVANRVIAVGTKSRAAVLAAHFEQQILYHESARGFVTYTGIFSGVHMSIVAIGSKLSHFLNFASRDALTSPYWLQ